MQNVSCSCGKSFRAQPHLAGKTVGCPACGQPIQVPAAPTGSIPVRCRCGKAFAAPPNLAGTQAHCPSCRGVLLIPHGFTSDSMAASNTNTDPLGIGGPPTSRTRNDSAYLPSSPPPTDSRNDEDANYSAANVLGMRWAESSGEPYRMNWKTIWLQEAIRATTRMGSC